MKKWTLMLLGCCASLMMWSCKGKDAPATTSENEETSTALNVKVPTVQKFVITTQDDMPLLKAPDPNSPHLINCMEDEESDMIDFRYQWSDDKVPQGYVTHTQSTYAGQVFAVLGEEGDYWRVSVKDGSVDVEAAYLLKSATEDIEPEPITAELMEQVASEIGLTSLVKTEGKYKGLSMQIEVNELWGEEKLWVGQLTNGIIVTPQSRISLIEYSETDTAINYSQDSERGVLFTYPKSMAKTTEEGYVMNFDPSKLTDDQIAQLLDKQDAATSTASSPTYIVCTYYFPMLEWKTPQFWLKAEE